MSKLKFNLDELLPQIFTEEGKEILIIQAVEGGLTNDPKYIETAIQYYIEEGLFGAAASLAQKKGDIETAIKYYELDGSFGCAYALAESEGCTEKAEKILYNKNPDLSKMLSLSETDKECTAFKYQNEIKKRADRICERADKFHSLSRLLYKEAISLYEKIGYFPRAREIAKFTGDTKKVKELLEKEIQNCEKNGDYKGAAELAKQTGNAEKAEFYKFLWEQFER